MLPTASITDYYTDSSGISKKIVETPVAFKTSAIKLYTVPKSPDSEPTKTAANQSEAKLIIETATTSVVKEESQPLLHSDNKVKVEAGKLSALDKIRKALPGNDCQAELLFQINHLKSGNWKKPGAVTFKKLKETKNPAVPSFQLALLRVKDENSFEVVTGNNIEKAVCRTGKK